MKSAFSFEKLTFENRFCDQLPGDPELKNFRRQVSGACFSKVKPRQVSAPGLVAYSKEMARKFATLYGWWWDD